MSETYYKAIVKTSKDLGIYKTIPNIEEAIRDEFVRCHNIFAKKANNGITDMLNEEFKKLYPNYFKDNSDKEWEDLHEYNEYLATGYTRYIVNDMNIKNVSEILDFYVDPNGAIFKAMLKTDHDIKIDLLLKQVEI